MSLVEEDVSFFRPIYDYFVQNVYDVRFFDFDNIFYTDDIEHDVRLFYDIPEKESAKDSNGITLFENKVSDSPVVIINANCSEKELCESVIHELVHVYDFNRFSNQFLRGTYNNIYNHIYFETYRNWSEFRAFSIDEFNAIRYNDIVNNRDNLDRLINEYSKLIPCILERARDEIADGKPTFYEVARIFGRIHSIDRYNSDWTFEESCIRPGVFSLLFAPVNPSIVVELFRLFFEADATQDIFPMLDEIHELNQNLYK